MKPIIIALLVVLLVIILEAGKFYYYIQIGRGLAATAKRYERVIPDAPYRLLITGDSTAYGTGVADPHDSVAGIFGAHYPHISITNRGENGRRIAEVSTSLNALADDSFDLMVLQVGGNDIIRFTPLDKLEKSLHEALTVAKKKAKHVVVLHSGNVGAAPIFPHPLDWIYSARTRQVRDIFMRQAKALDATYVDLFAERTADPFLADIKNSYAPDYLHLGSRGNRIWFEKIVEALRERGVELPTS